LVNSKLSVVIKWVNVKVNTLEQVTNTFSFNLGVRWGWVFIAMPPAALIPGETR
jgi:hypothetical protein